MVILFVAHDHIMIDTSPFLKTDLAVRQFTQLENAVQSKKWIY
jgi:hypothetical protein